MQIREADIQDVEDIKNLYLQAFDNSEAELVSNASIADTTSHIGIALTLSYFYNTSNFSMNVEITSASVTDKSVIRQMMELYQYDFSEFTKADLNEHGHFGYPCLDRTC